MACCDGDAIESGLFYDVSRSRGNLDPFLHMTGFRLLLSVASFGYETGCSDLGAVQSEVAPGESDVPSLRQATQRASDGIGTAHFADVSGIHSSTLSISL